MRTNGSIWGLVGGFLICLGLGGMRFWSSGGSDQGIFISVTLALIELGLVILLGRKASGYKNRLIYFLRCREENDRQDALVEAARTSAERSEKDLEDIRNQIAVIREHVKDRVSRLGQIEHLRELAVKTVLDGYYAGIDEQEGRFHTPWKYADNDDEGEED